MQLLEYLSSKGISQSELARALGISSTHANRLVHKKRIPSIYLARKIEEVTKGEVPVYELLDIKIPKEKETKK